MNNAFRSLNMVYNLKMLLLVDIIFYYNCPYKKPDKPGHKNYLISLCSSIKFKQKRSSNFFKSIKFH